MIFVPGGYDGWGTLWLIDRSGALVWPYWTLTGLLPCGE